MFEREIKKVTLKSNEPHKETRKQKSMLFDMSIEFDDGEFADIELQARNEAYDYGVRAETLAARLLANSARRKRKWDAPKVYHSKKTSRMQKPCLPMGNTQLKKFLSC